LNFWEHFILGYTSIQAEIRLRDATTKALLLLSFSNTIVLRIRRFEKVKGRSVGKGFKLRD
jgi:hypothetical protein